MGVYSQPLINLHDIALLECNIKISEFNILYIQYLRFLKGENKSNSILFQSASSYTVVFLDAGTYTRGGGLL